MTEGMNLTRLRTPIAAIVIAILVSAFVAACGGSSSSSEDPQQALKETFNNPKKITSGKLNISLSADASGTQSGNFTAQIDGPFQSSGDKTQLPELDLTAKVSGQGAGTPSISFEGGLVATKTDAFLEYQGQAYQIPSSLYQQYRSLYAQQAAAQASAGSNSSSVFKQLGIDPSTWLTNVSNEGTTDVGGVTTIHIAGDADIGKIVSDFSKVAQSVPGATAQVPTGAQLSQVEKSVKTAHVDVYTGEDDHLLRKLSIALDFAPPAGSSSGISSLKFDLSFELDNVNEPQTITAPSNAKPLSDLAGQFGGLLGGLSGAGGTSSLPGGSGGSLGGGGSASAGSAASQKYIQCALNAAGNQAAINKCAAEFLGK
jgi:hypothetical protein